MKYIVRDFAAYPNDKYGVFFYSEQVFLRKDDPAMNLTRSYLFRFVLLPEITKENAQNYRDLSKNLSESLSFVHTCRLSDYISERKLNVPWKKDEEETVTFTELDCRKLAQDAAPELLAEAEKRFARKSSDTIPDPVSLPGENAEFLEFTTESAGSWGGPFELNGRQGCGAIAKANTKKQNPEINIYDYSYWNCSTKVCRELDEIAEQNGHPDGDYLFARAWTAKDKKDYFLKLDVSEQIVIVRSYLSWRGDEYFEGLRPFQLYLFGNDDCSYSKWFDTAAEMEEELNYLRMMQPLDFVKDIKERNYIFTN